MIATLIILGINVLGLGTSLALHGKDKGKYNFWLHLVSFVFAMILYYYAGLFDNFNNQ